MRTLIIGASGSSAEIALMLNDSTFNTKNHVAIGFVDDDISLHKQKILGLEVLGSTDLLKNYPDCGYISGIGSEKNFRNRLSILMDYKRFLEPIICVSKFSIISQESYIAPGAVVSPYCFIGSHVKVHDFVYIMPNTTISHHTYISAGTIICSGVNISGNVEIGESCYIGAGVTIKNNLKIASGVLVGSGSNVVSDIIEQGVYIGNPARKLDKHS